MNKDKWLLLLLFAYLLVNCGMATSPSYAAVEDAVAVQPSVGDPLVARYIGKTVIQTDEFLSLRSAGEDALSDFCWKLEGRIVSTSSELTTLLSKPGDYTLELSYRDTQGSSYSTKALVRVMEPEAYRAMLTAIQAAHLPLWLVDEEVYLPTVTR